MTDDNSGEKRRQFGAFLRSRRERLIPADVGLASGFRRRTPGLRREEVALLAGVGATWYTWLEQGRDVRPSGEVLAALAGALKLDAAEKRHIFDLNDRPAPLVSDTGPEVVPETILRMLDSLTGQPAQVLGRRWDILAWNRAAQAVFGDYGRLAGDARNILYLLFADAGHRRLLVDREDLARQTLALFRAESARHADDPAFSRLVAMLMEKSAEFREWWPRHDVVRALSKPKRIRHPAAGDMLFDATGLAVAENDGLKLVVYTPRNEFDSVAKLAQLLARPD